MNHAFNAFSLAFVLAARRIHQPLAKAKRRSSFSNAARPDSKQGYAA